MIRYLREILDLLGEGRRRLPWLAVLFLAASLLDLAGIGLVGPYVALVLDAGLLDGPLGRVVELLGVPRAQAPALIALGGCLVAVFLLKTATAIAIQRSIVLFSQMRKVTLQDTLMRAYQHMPYTEFLRRNSAEYVQSIGDQTTYFAAVVQVGLRVTSEGLVTAAILAFLGWQDPKALAILAVFLGLMIAGYDRLLRRRLGAYGRQANDAAVLMVRGIHQGIEGLKEIRILGKEDHFRRMATRGASDFARFRARADMVTRVPRYLVELGMVVFVVGMVFVSLMLHENPGLVLPSFSVIAVAALRMIPAANTLSTGLIDLRYYRDAISRLHRDAVQARGLPLEETGRQARADAEPFRTLSLDRVTFSHQGASQPVLRDLSLRITAGESVGLIGASGAGKTTLIDVMLGLLEPQQGAIAYNGRPLRDALGEWRSHVAYLPQQPFLIDDSLRCNVALGVDEADIDDARVHEALQQARLAELVGEWPDGLETLLGERGVRLSGGQRQRVILARAFYHGRHVLVMDEATSALDRDTEREIVEEIRQLKGRHTIVVIAHRPSTVQHCDRICLLENGRLIELGSHDQAFGPASGHHPSGPGTAD